MIKVLDQHTIDKIAAGEVIERPASVVKELVENSIDAKSTRVTVEISDGGTKLIRVTDNGVGIEADDVRKAYMSHATSKLDNIDDLLTISSLGFRGEALSTIAAVSQVEMITKPHTALTGIRYEIQGGKEIELKEVGAPDGTTIISRNLFYNTPARLKFLKSNMTEGSYISDLMSHIALANPGVKIKLISNGKTLIDTQGDGRLKETIYTLYGKEITQGLLEVDHTEGEIKITGFIGKPYLSKGNRSFENYFVNKRYIKSIVVNKAIEEAYKTHIMQHKFPYTALFLELPPYMVDVNVHPAKREFRFDDEKGLFSAVYHAVANTLKGKDFIPEVKADYQTKQTIYTPPVREEPKVEEKKFFSSISSNTVEDKPDYSKSNENANISSHTQLNENKASSDIQAAASDLAQSGAKSEASSSLFNSQEKKSATYKVSDIVRTTGSSSGFSILDSLLPQEYREKLAEVTSGADNTSNSDAASNDEEVPETENPKIEYPEKYEQLEMSEARFLSEEAKGHHKIIGQVFNTYWITEYDGVLYFMDQHAAHEKVNFERFKAEFEKRTFHSQNIFPGEIINLSSLEKKAVLENIDYLRGYGFELEDFGGNDIKLSALPANLIGLDGREVFMELTDYITKDMTEVTEDIFIRKLATMGCKAAIKGNQEISEYEAGLLIEELMKLKDPYTCPHGRPTLIKMSKEDLDKKFKRIVD